MSNKSIVLILQTVLFLITTASSSLGQHVINGSEKDFIHSQGILRQTRPVGGYDFQSLLSNLLAQSNSDVIGRAEGLFKNLFQGENRFFEMKSKCLKDFGTLLEALITGERWALRMIDAIGKPHTELMNGHFTWLGSYDECTAIEATVNISGMVSHPYTGRYCLASFEFEKVEQLSLLAPDGITFKIGICMPNSCNDEDTATLLETLLSLLPVNTTGFPEPDVSCQVEHMFDAKAIAAIFICSLFGLVIASATAYDIIVVQWLGKRTKTMPRNEKDVSNGYGEKVNAISLDTYGKSNLPDRDSNEEAAKTDMGITPHEDIYKQGISAKGLLLSFSIYTNASKILNTKQPPGSLTAVNGIRFISMTWVILGHNFAFALPPAENIATYAPEILKRFTFEAIKNALVSVDTFFTLSGLLVSYLSLKEMKKRGGAKKFQWGMFYFHRVWRLTPPYMLFMMFYVCLLPYWYDGPQWPQYGINTDTCGDYWWRNLLYINNFFKVSKMCMAWSWYLANDMQFYVLSPLMLIPLYYSSVFGMLSCGALLLVCFVSTGVISSSEHLLTNVVFDRSGKLFDDIYVKPWGRIGPYIVGFFAGYILYRTNCKIRMPKVVNLIGWLLATGVALTVLYGTYDASGTPKLDNTAAALYNAVHRSAWGLAVSWVIVACATGNGGFINTILSWRAMIPLSRLTYCAYLVHPIVMFTYIYSRRTLIYFTDLEAIYLFCGNLCLSYAVAFVVSLAFESPMMGLEKALLGRKKNS